MKLLAAGSPFESHFLPREDRGGMSTEPLRKSHDLKPGKAEKGADLEGHLHHIAALSKGKSEGFPDPSIY